MKYKSCTIGFCGDQLHMHQGICMSCGHLPTWLQASFDVKFCRR